MMAVTKILSIVRKILVRNFVQQSNNDAELMIWGVSGAKRGTNTRPGSDSELGPGKAVYHKVARRGSVCVQ